MSERDHYEVLGVSTTATHEEIKFAFRRLAAQHHPDKNPDDPRAHVRFKEINASYQVLSDPVTVKQVAGDTFLPVLKVPKAIFIATVKF